MSKAATECVIRQVSSEYNSAKFIPVKITSGNAKYSGWYTRTIFDKMKVFFKRYKKYAFHIPYIYEKSNPTPIEGTIVSDTDIHLDDACVIEYIR